MNKQSACNFVPGIELLHAHFDSLIARSVANAYWKDSNNKYLDANVSQILKSGIQSHDYIIGASDYDLAWKEFAPMLIDHDTRVMTEERPMLFIEPVRISQIGHEHYGQVVNYLSYKSPLLNHSGNVIGIYGLSYSLNGEIGYQKILNEFSLMTGKHGMEIVRKLLARYLYPTHNLSSRQLECLERFAKGMTMKQIGDSLSLSCRTVEHYLNAVKVKLNCASRNDLVNAAINLGLLDVSEF